MKILVQTLVAAALLTMVVAQTAGGGTRPDDRPEARLPGGLSQEGDSLGSTIAIGARPDDRSGVRLPGGVVTHPADLPTTFVPDALERYRANALPANDALDRYLANTPDGSQPPLGAGPTPVSGGFDWADAAIGAMVAFGIALLVAAASIGGLRRRRTAALS